VEHEPRTDNEAVIDRDHVADILRAYSIDYPGSEELSEMPDETIQRIVVWHIKEEKQSRPELDVEEIGKKCFKEAWKEGDLQ
jgi:hypothetical protein